MPVGKSTANIPPCRYDYQSTADYAKAMENFYAQPSYSNNGVLRKASVSGMNHNTVSNRINSAKTSASSTSKTGSSASASYSAPKASSSTSGTSGSASSYKAPSAYKPSSYTSSSGSSSKTSVSSYTSTAPKPNDYQKTEDYAKAAEDYYKSSGYSVTNEIRASTTTPKKNDYQNTQDYAEAATKYYKSSGYSVTNEIKKSSHTNTVISGNGGIQVKYDINDIHCQSTEYGGDYEGWNGCYATSINNMWRVNDGAEGNKILDTYTEKNEISGILGQPAYYTDYIDDFGNSHDKSKVFTGSNGKYSSVSIKNLSENDAKKLIDNELQKGKIVAVRISHTPNGHPDNGHTLNISGKDENGNYLYNDCGKGSTEKRHATKLNNLANDYFPTADGKWNIIIDTTK